MKWIEQYKKNKPLINSTLTGLFYFLFCWSLDFGDETKGLFITLMLFLPGLTFPLTTCYYTTEKIPYADIRRIIHLFLSVAIYHGSVWLFTGEGLIEYITVFAGIIGSFLFLSVTKYLLRKKISFLQILFTSLLSGLAFLQYEMTGRKGFYMGVAIFLWTLANGLVLNLEFRKAYKN